MNHLSAEQLVDYFAGIWTSDQERMIEAHLADCERCVGSARNVYANIRTMDEWTVTTHRDAEVPVLVSDAEPMYAFTSASPPNYGRRLTSLARATGAFVGTLLTSTGSRQRAVEQPNAKAQKTHV